MKKVLIITYTAFVLIIIANYFYYKSLYNKQISYIIALLDRQAQIVGLSVDETNNQFVPDLTQIGFSEDLAVFFSDPEVRSRTIEKMKLFYTKYQNLVTGIKIFDNNRNEFTLKKDRDKSSGEWLENSFILHVQGEIMDRDQLIEINRKFEYYLPVLKDNGAIGNIVVSVDFINFFDEIFSVFNLKDYQWQWVVGDSGIIVYDNSETAPVYGRISEISDELDQGAIGNIIHTADMGGESKEIISSFYSTQLIQRNLGLVFSAPTDFFQKYIIRNSLFIVLATLFLIQLIIYVFWRFLRSKQAETQRLSDSEKMLFRLIEEMPVGVIIHNKNREIIKANKVAAAQYSFKGEEEMKGKIFPETASSEASNYFSRNLGGNFNPDQFVIIKKEVGEIILYRNSIPVIFMGEESNMEILIDVTMLESARKQEARANEAKSEFLARMSYEIRTPLNGIIGMTDVLSRNELNSETKEIVYLLRRSAEVLLNIINDILDFSKIESGKMILDEMPFDLREEIAFCSDLARTHIDGSNIVFSSEIDENVPSGIIADPFRLRQILTNLTNHAIRNTNNGEIRLRCKLISGKAGILNLGFEIADTGISFDKASLKKIFGDYVNIESKAIRSNDETGFSTILARQLIELMGGHLAAESPSGLPGGKGTKVTFTITAYSNDKIIKNTGQEKITSFERLKVLAITGAQNRDEEVLGVFHKLGLDLSVTTYQKSTIGQIKANLSKAVDKYHLIVIFDDDEFDGFIPAQEMWDNNLSANLIVLMISSNDQKGNYLKGRTIGVDHYLVKPFVALELVSIFRESFPLIKQQSSSADLANIKKDLNILVVEDNKMNQKVLVTMLNNLGYSCDISEDGYSGFQQARSKKYDLIFMDLILPEMDGFEAARRILTVDKSVIIVAFTADNMPESIKKAELSGIKDFISKPVRIEELKRLFARYFMNS